MPRRAPLRTDSLPALICCSRREPTSTPLRGPCAKVLSKPRCRVVGVQSTLLAVSVTQPAFYVLAWLSPDGTAG